MKAFLVVLSFYLIGVVFAIVAIKILNKLNANNPCRRKEGITTLAYSWFVGLLFLGIFEQLLIDFREWCANLKWLQKLDTWLKS